LILRRRRNARIHGVTFEEAIETFNDPNQVVMENCFVAEDGEQRYQLIGMTTGLVVLLVVYVNRSNRDEEIVRIISARKANAYEERIYSTATSQNH
jgi:uncharacterized DUF497 family protein